MKPFKETTITTRVLEGLIRADDFMTARQIQEKFLPDKTPTRVATALVELRNFNAVGCIEQYNRLWWFATPDEDTRTRIVHERTPESRPRRRARRRPA